MPSRMVASPASVRNAASFWATRDFGSGGVGKWARPKDTAATLQYSSGWANVELVVVRRNHALFLLFCRLFTRSSTTAGSASVLVSPKLPNSSSAILRRMRRMILPERVLGSDGAN